METATQHRDIERKITEMLTQNTGASMLDSGGAYGRHWEENQEKAKAETDPVEAFKNEPELEFDVWDGEISYFSLNIFHYLTTYLEVTETSKTLNKRFHEMAEGYNYRLFAMEEFAGQMEDGYLCAGDKITNTYNYDNILSQTLQYNIFYYGGDAYINLQIHGGCDVRGGYTAPQVFRLIEPGYFHSAQRDVYAYDMGGNHHNWHTDDGGYHWYYNGSTENEIPLESVLEYDESEDKFYNSETGNEIVFTPFLEF